MTNKKSPFRKQAFSIFLFLACFVLFGWPLLSLVDSHPAGMFIYLFVVWGVVIIVLFFMSRNNDSPPSPEEKTSDGIKTDV